MGAIFYTNVEAHYSSVAAGGLAAVAVGAENEGVVQMTQAAVMGGGGESYRGRAHEPHAAPRWVQWPWWVVPAVTLGVLLTACGAAGATSTAAPAMTDRAAPNGQITLLDGTTTTTIASFRGNPTLVWFVAGGCASCAASIPTVARAFPAFASARAHILVLGLYGAFSQGSQAANELASFGRAAAGAAFTDPIWTWGLASASLTAAYDPEGVPDEYFLLDPAGRLVYQSSVPVSTMGALLGHLRALTAGHLPAGTTSP